MKSTTITCTTMIALITLVGATDAVQRAGSTQDSRDHRPPRPPVDAAIDANGDHWIDADEIAGAVDALWALDADDNGELSAEECLPKPPGDRARSHQGGGSEHHPQMPEPPIFNALDISDDDVIDASEIATAATSLLTLDRDDDGRLSPDECRPQVPNHTAGRN